MKIKKYSLNIRATIIAFLFLGLGNSVYAQKSDFKRHFVNMTEIGVIAGHVVYDYNYWNWNGSTTQTIAERKISPTIQTFNGVQLTDRLAVGMTTGIDLYNAALIVPLAAGTRYDLLNSKTKKVGFFGALDTGYGLSASPDVDNFKSKGGFIINPHIGLRFGLKSKVAFLLTLGYKHQQMHIEKTPLSSIDVFRYEDRRYNRVSLRLGLAF